MVGVGRPLYKTGEGVRLAFWSPFGFVSSMHTQALSRLVLNEGFTSAFRLHKYSAQVEPKKCEDWVIVRCTLIVRSCDT